MLPIVDSKTKPKPRQITNWLRPEMPAAVPLLECAGCGAVKEEDRAWQHGQNCQYEGCRKVRFKRVPAGPLEGLSNQQYLDVLATKPEWVGHDMVLMRRENGDVALGARRRRGEKQR